jgi:hypothetical protein
MPAQGEADMSRLTIKQRQRLLRATERKRAEAEQAYKATRKQVWLARMRDLTTECLRLAR